MPWAGYIRLPTGKQSGSCTISAKEITQHMLLAYSSGLGWTDK